MSWFDWVCIALLVLFVGGYIWIRGTDRMSPPEEPDGGDPEPSEQGSSAG